MPELRDFDDILAGSHDFISRYNQCQLEVTVKDRVHQLVAACRLICTVEEHNIELAWVESSAGMMRQIGCNDSIALLV